MINSYQSFLIKLHDFCHQENDLVARDLARETEALARAEDKTFSKVIQDALRRARIAAAPRASGHPGLLESQGARPTRLCGAMEDSRDGRARVG